MMKKVLVIPSWYATPEAPTSGSFFREQALLMEDKSIGAHQWQMQVLTTDKNWIGRKRNFLYMVFPSKESYTVSTHFMNEMNGIVITYPYSIYSSIPYNFQREVRAVIQYFKDNPSQLPDLIHAHCAFTGGILARYISEHFHIPYIVTEHSGPFLLHGYSSHWQKEIVASLTQAHTVLAVSEHQRQQLLLHQIQCNPITVGNLVDDAVFTIASELTASEKTRFLIVTYYPNFIKDMGTFFEALALLKEAGTLDEKVFTIVGGGELEGEYQSNYYTQEVERLQLHEVVRIIPSAKRAEMVTLLQASDCLLSTSIAETFGVAICEAMLCGKPVIMTDNGGCRDYATADNSVVVPIHDPQALADAITRFERHLFNAETIRESIVPHYGRAAFRARMEDVYLATLSNQKM